MKLLSYLRILSRIPVLKSSNMKNYFLPTILCLLFSLKSFSQGRNQIPLVNLVDDELTTEIKNIIHEQLAQHADSVTGYFVDGKGYIVVEIDNHSISDTVNCYIVRPDQNAIENDNLSNAYALVEDRPVLIYHINSGEAYNPAYSKKSIRKFNKMMDRYLSSPEHIKAKDEDGNIVIDDKSFRSPFITTSMSKIIYTFKNKPATIKRHLE